MEEDGHRGWRRVVEERLLVLLHRIGKGRGRCAIVYARVPPYRTHRIHSRIPTTYTRRAERAGVMRGTRSVALDFLLLDNPVYSTSLFLRSG